MAIGGHPNEPITELCVEAGALDGVVRVGPRAMPKEVLVRVAFVVGPRRYRLPSPHVRPPQLAVLDAENGRDVGGCRFLEVRDNGRRLGRAAGVPEDLDLGVGVQPARAPSHWHLARADRGTVGQRQGHCRQRRALAVHGAHRPRLHGRLPHVGEAHGVLAAADGEPSARGAAAEGLVQGRLRLLGEVVPGAPRTSPSVAPRAHERGVAGAPRRVHQVPAAHAARAGRVRRRGLQHPREVDGVDLAAAEAHSHGGLARAEGRLDLVVGAARERAPVLRAAELPHRRLPKRQRTDRF
mmetsp:Transcript_12820/g.36857  ORF Transcript_12820/g.36857 Transcript_12820/m.36857 type:complete len:296 (+) Transcript_12820:281-1168(+)